MIVGTEALSQLVDIETVRTDAIINRFPKGSCPLHSSVRRTKMVVGSGNGNGEERRGRHTLRLKKPWMHYLFATTTEKSTTIVGDVDVLTGSILSVVEVNKVIFVDANREGLTGKSASTMARVLVDAIMLFVWDLIL